MSTAAAKIHVGLITQDKAWEGQIKDGLAQMGGGYVHCAKSMLELYQKMGMQKVQLIVYVAPPGETGAEAQALVSFFRGKKDYAQIPVCILVDAPQVQMNRLLNDPRVRGFSAAGGSFLALMTMQPMVNGSGSQDFIEPISTNWIQNEFLESLQGKVGQISQFSVRAASEDDLRAGFFCQFVDEVRSHLGWFKFSARLQEGSQEGMKALFAGLSREGMEEMAQVLLTAIVGDFKSKVEMDLQGRGAIFYPPIDELPAPERKIVYAGSKSTGLLFESAACNVVLEVIQYV